MTRAPDSGSLRLGRALTVTVISIVLSALAHGRACGVLPPLPVLSCVLPVLGWFAWRGSVREFSLGWLVTAVIGSQVALHVLYALAEAPVQSQGTSMAMGGDTMASSMTPGFTLMPGGWQMLLGHLLTAAVVVGWLRAGERVLWRAVRKTADAVATVVRRLVAPWHDARPLARLKTLPFGYVPRRPVEYLLTHAVCRRGPPMLVVAPF